ncbi:uncharacterized protein LOC111717966 isoform X3 [Eurytemora carolleeae]|nr:uncharacterized protein LOC111717966 isoform X3 [Eurytemora carolleeae]|eukprot:XP_023349201.1 uncharacterized protein LOC111717966 isoform X3 [Eurytemora affinis]
MSPGSYQKFSIFVVEILDGSTAEYKPCAQFEGRFKTLRKEFECVNEGQKGQFVYIRDDRMDTEYFGLCEIQVFQAQEVEDCGSPELPLNSQLFSLTPSQAEYSCAPGFTLTPPGRGILNCSKEGWQGQIPTCSELSCDHPTSAKDGFIEVSNFRGNYVYGSRAKYHCNPGYILWGNSTRVCDESGEWTGHPPTCRPISCGEPPMLPKSAVALLNGSAQWRSIAQYSCLPGYQFMDGITNVRESACQDTGAWSAVTFSCVPIQPKNSNPINTIWIKERNDKNSPSYMTITLLSLLAAVIFGISVLAAIITFKRWVRKMEYAQQENIFVEKPLLENQHEHNHQAPGQEPVQLENNHNNKFSTFHLRYSPSSSPTSSAETRTSSPKNSNCSMERRHYSSSCCRKQFNSMPRMQNGNLRFKYADIDELSRFKYADIDELSRFKYANIDELSRFKYADIDELSRFQYLNIGELFMFKYADIDELSRFQYSDIDEFSRFKYLNIDKLSRVKYADIDELSRFKYADIEELSRFKYADIDELSRFKYADIDELSRFKFADIYELSRFKYAGIDELSRFKYADIDELSRFKYADIYELSRFKYADIDELLQRRSNLNVFEDAVQYANVPVIPRPIHYATLSRAKRQVEHQEMSQGDSVPDILQTIAQLDSHTKPNPAFGQLGGPSNPNQTSTVVPNQTQEHVGAQPKPNVIVNELSGMMFTNERKLIDLDDEQFNYLSINQTQMDDSV